MEGRSWLQAWLALLLVLFLLSVSWRNLPEEQSQAQYSRPIYEYAHNGEAASVTGGHVYHGAAVPSLAGKYIFGDYTYGRIWALERTDGGPQVELLIDSLEDPAWEARLSASAFGIDDAGELYVADRGGSIWRFTEANGTLALVDTFPGLEFVNPVGLAATGDGRLCIVEQPGRVICPHDGNATVLLDIRETVNDDDWEQGLLGLAFHPGFAENGRFFVTYTTYEDGALRLAEFSASANMTGARNHANLSSQRVLLKVAQPYPNHNGGHLEFGPDGYLWLGLGDGGKYSDAFANAQNLETLLGSLLRLDIDDGNPYGIPDDNPFADGGGRPEIWAYGFRNPWKFSFDPATSELWLGDVGQDEWEEINIVERGGNYGWAYYEGMHCYESPFEFYDGWDCSGLDLQAERAWLWERVLLNPLALLLLGGSLFIARRLGQQP
ncbi:MAG: PQQ-dependent sugar dehydrogenase [Candidatus Poseidoniia archaeon]|nr:PQQ-dependent sugar dehydrogenase [Candidatus Poseidoniia archaeon]